MTISTSIFDAGATTALIKTYLGGDVHENEEPVHDDARDLDAVDFNKVVAGLAEVAKRLRQGNLVAYPFSQANCTASQTDVDLARDGASDAARLYATAWRAGSVVGLAVHVENARSAGTLTVKWTKNAAEQTMTCVIDGSNTQKNRSYQLPAVEAIAAKDALGVSITTDGSWAAGTTPSISVDLIVAYEEDL